MDFIDDGSTALAKQRRSLMIFSLILAAIYGADMELGRQVQAQGLVAQIGRPWVLIAGLWAGWAYSYYRYWLHFRAAKPRGIEVPLNDIRVLKIRAFLAKHGRELARSGRIQVSSKIMLDHAYIGYQGYQHDGESLKHGSQAVGIMIHNTDPKTGDAVGQTENAIFKFTTGEWRGINRKTKLDFRMRHPHTTDFVAPFYIALAAPIAGIVDLVRRII